VEQSITPVASALLASDAYQIELADQISEDNCAISGHGGRRAAVLEALPELNNHCLSVSAFRALKSSLIPIMLIAWLDASKEHR
jgi:hypothetical protein